MAGQLIERGANRYLLRVYLGRDGNGKKLFVNKTVRGTKKQAQAVLNALLVQKDTGDILPDTRVTLDQHLDRWLEDAVKQRVRPETYREYSSTMQRYVRPKLGARRLCDIRPRDVQELYAGLQARGLGGTAPLVHVLLKNAFGQAVKWEQLRRNPCDGVASPKRPPASKMRAMDLGELERFLNAAERSRWSVLFQLLAATGLRPSEALALRWRDLDLAAAALTVSRRVRWDKNAKCFRFDAPKTRASRRTISLPYGLVQLLSDHMARSGTPSTDDLMFTSRSGETPHEGMVVGAFKRALRNAGLDTAIRLYDLRHTHATLLLAAGVNPKVAAERLGHSSVKITLDTYSHVMPGMQEEAAAQLDTMLYGGSSKVAGMRMPN